MCVYLVICILWFCFESVGIWQESPDFRLADHKPIQNDWLCTLIFLPHGLLPWEQPCKQQRGAEI